MSRLFRFSDFFKTFCAIFLVASITVSLLPSVNVQAQSLDVAPESGNVEDTEAPKDGTTCAVEKIGWILCPIMEGAAKIADKTFSVLANNFLQVEPQLLADDGAKPAWDLARNLANIMFVIAFLAIV